VIGKIIDRFDTAIDQHSYRDGYDGEEKH